jgi:hypothetical protein
MNQQYMPTNKKTKSKRKSRRIRRRSSKKQISSVLQTRPATSSPTMFTIVLPNGTLLYKQKFEKQFELRPQFEWFSEKRGYGTSYGDFTDIYELTENLQLFDLGKGRAWLMNQYYQVNGADMCDEQYSGGEANMKFHKSIEVFLDQNGYHGTIVREETDSLDCGPSEIVLTPKTIKNKKLSKVKTNSLSV